MHADAPTAADTDWSQIVALYDQLTGIDPSPIVALNRAVAIAELDGPEVALAIVDGLPLTSRHAWHATRAELLRRLGRSAEAAAAYDAPQARRAGHPMTHGSDKRVGSLNGPGPTTDNVLLGTLDAATGSDLTPVRGDLRAGRDREPALTSHPGDHQCNLFWAFAYNAARGAVGG